MSLLTIIVALAIVAALLFERWLDRRQVRHVAAHRDEVPAAFAGRFSLDEHRKAADYTIARVRHGIKQDIARRPCWPWHCWRAAASRCCTPRS